VRLLLLVAALCGLVATSAVAGAGERPAPRAPEGAAERPAPAAPEAAAEQPPLAVLHERYGPRPAQTADVHLPPAAARRSGGAPAVLLVHGGGWFAGDKRRMTPVAAALAAAGFVVVNVNYTLATPERPGFPVQLRDLRRALAWATAAAPRLGADPRRIGALGSSAGGTLAALLAVDAREPAVGSATAGARGAALPRGGAATGAPRLRAVATWSAPLDLATLPPGQLRALATRFVGCPRLACRARLAAASPLRGVTPQTPPTLLVNARRELVPAQQARATAAALAQAGVAHQLLLVPGAAHGRELAPQALAPTIAFLRARL